MFYTPEVLGRKGPLATVWLAAHFEKKLTRSNVLGVDLIETIKMISDPRVKFSLRVSADLMVGVCMLHNRQVWYLCELDKKISDQIKSITALLDEEPTKKIKRSDNVAGRPKDSVDLANLPEIDELEILQPDQVAVPSGVSMLKSTFLEELPAFNLDPEEMAETYFLREESHVSLTGDDFGKTLPPQPPADSVVDAGVMEDLPAPTVDMEDLPAPTGDMDDIRPPAGDSAVIFSRPTAPPFSSTPLTLVSKRPVNQTPEKGRQATTTTSIQIGSLELPSLEETTTPKKGRKRGGLRGRRKRKGPIIDVTTMITREEMIAGFRKITFNPVEFAVPERWAEQPLFLRPGRILPKVLQRYFDAAKDNKVMDENLQEQATEPSVPAPKLTTTIELVNDPGTMQDDFFGPLPPPPSPPQPQPLDTEFPSIDLPDIPMDDYDNLPQARQDTGPDGALTRPGVITPPVFAFNDRSLIEERFNQSFQNSFTHSNPVTFDEAILPHLDDQTRKTTAAIYFHYLLERQNAGEIILEQEQSWERFNSIKIIRI